MFRRALALCCSLLLLLLLSVALALRALLCRRALALALLFAAAPYIYSQVDVVIPGLDKTVSSSIFYYICVLILWQPRSSSTVLVSKDPVLFSIVSTVRV